MHDRLVGHIGHFSRNREELKEMTNTWVPDEFVFCIDSNVHHVESKVVHYQSVWKTKLPRWCLEGLTRMQRRRMQQERQEDLYKDEIHLSLKIGSSWTAIGKDHR